MDDTSSFNKVRTYRCVCGNLNIRPLRGEGVDPCENCHRSLAGLRPRIDDCDRLRHALLEAAEGRPEHLEDL
jgi:hypothetical protein